MFLVLKGSKSAINNFHKVFFSILFISYLPKVHGLKMLPNLDTTTGISPILTLWSLPNGPLLVYSNKALLPTIWPTMVEV
jgi:hypothetical protein